MSMKIIKGCDAHNIARKVALKAFEHLLKPLCDRQDEFAIEAFNATLQHLGLDSPTIELYRDHGIFDPDDEHIITTIYRNVFDGNETFEVTVVGTNNEWMFHRASNPYATIKQHEFSMPVRRLVITDEYHNNIMRELRSLIVAQQKNLEALKQELYENINGRTCKEVMKEWPEIAPYVIECMGLVNKAPVMFKPLDQLLARYLPALGYTPEAA